MSDANSLKIEHWRDEIDRVDEDLLRLFNERAHYAIEIGLEKRRLGMPFAVPEREAAIVRAMVARNHGPLDAEAIQRLFEAVIAESQVAEQAMAEGGALPS
jgi:chorismate mutase